MKTHTCYWIEPFRVFASATKHKDWRIIVGILFMILNFATLGTLKVLVALCFAIKDERKFILKPCRNFFEIMGKSLSQISLGGMTGMGFGEDD